MGKTVSVYVQTDVDVDLDEFYVGDLVDYIRSKGYTVLNSDGPYNKDFDLDREVWSLYQTFLKDDGEGNKMDRELRKFFAGYYNKVSV
jgi:hypothetical protein